MSNLESEVWKFLAQMAGALKYLHSQHPPVIHRDLKHENIIGKKMVGGIQWKIADFGIARVLGKNAYGAYYARTQIGTEYYMAPEALMVRRTMVDCYNHTITATFLSGYLLLHSCRYVVPGCSDVLLLQPETSLP